MSPSYWIKIKFKNKIKNTIHISSWFLQNFFKSFILLHCQILIFSIKREKKSGGGGVLKQNFSQKIYIYLQSSNIYIFPFSSMDDSEAESSIVEFEIVSDWLPLSLSEVPDGLSSTGCFKNQYIILAVNVRIIFWFTWLNVPRRQSSVTWTRAKCQKKKKKLVPHYIIAWTK